MYGMHVRTNTAGVQQSAPVAIVNIKCSVTSLLGSTIGLNLDLYIGVR